MGVAAGEEGAGAADRHGRGLPAGPPDSPRNARKSASRLSLFRMEIRRPLGVGGSYESWGWAPLFSSSSAHSSTRPGHSILSPDLGRGRPSASAPTGTGSWGGSAPGKSPRRGGTRHPGPEQLGLSLSLVSVSVSLSPDPMPNLSATCDRILGITRAKQRLPERVLSPRPPGLLESSPSQPRPRGSLRSCWSCSRLHPDAAPRPGGAGGSLSHRPTLGQSWLAPFSYDTPSQTLFPAHLLPPGSQPAAPGCSVGSPSRERAPWLGCRGPRSAPTPARPCASALPCEHDDIPGRDGVLGLPETRPQSRPTS